MNSMAEPDTKHPNTAEAVPRLWASLWSRSNVRNKSVRRCGQSLCGVATGVKCGATKGQRSLRAASQNLARATNDDSLFGPEMNLEPESMMT